jgi:hypothetical protein
MSEAETTIGLPCASFLPVSHWALSFQRTLKSVLSVAAALTLVQLLRKLPVVGTAPPKVVDSICAFAAIDANGSTNTIVKRLIAMDLDLAGEVIPGFSFAMSRESITR